jgi:hypothetical protein
MFTVDLTTNSYLIKNTEKESNNIFSDINVISNAATHYSNPDILLNIIKSGDFNEINNTLKDDSESYVGWTYVADYKTHLLSRNLGKCYYIHARINRENNLEFGIFDSIINSKNFKVENI